MEYPISVQPTPNPNALKFVLTVPAKSRESAVFKTPEDAKNIPLAAALLAIEGVSEVYFSGHFITVTQNGTVVWDDLEEKIKTAIGSALPTHNPDFSPVAVATAPAPGGELARINEILDRTVRPALQHDGGDLQVIALDGKNLTISYEGACGCCPHAAMGTLYAIQNVLRDQYDSEIVVEMA